MFSAHGRQESTNIHVCSHALVVKHELIPFLNSFGLRALWMWGHSTSCPCTICLTLPRIHYLIQCGSALPGFVETTGERVRVWEADLRDEIYRRTNLPPPPPPQVATTPVPAFGSKGVEKGAGLNPSPKTSKGEPGCTPKAVPLQKAKEAEKVAVKEEHIENKESLQEVTESEPARGSGRSQERRQEKRSERRKRSRHRDRREGRDQERETDKKERRERRSSRGEEESPRRKESRAKAKSISEEGKAREKEAEREERKRPREPSHPPPTRRPENQPRVPQGRGWRGPVPRSDHPRWYTAKNKGVVKRAKQELYAQNQRKWRPS